MIGILFLLFASLLNPLGLHWDKKYLDVPTIENYKYYFGDVKWGLVVYLGEDLDEMETELQLMYAKRFLSSALLILGPFGLNTTNCLKKYKSVVGMLNQKYGHFSHQKELKDPLIEELLFPGHCNATKVGLYKVDTIWRKGQFIVEATLVGYEEGIYIEITYSNTKLNNSYKKERRKRILKRL
jgi:hypothetical protein